MNEIDRELFEDDIPEIYCHCGEMMDEIPEEHSEDVLVFDCPECGRRKFFNAHTKEDITTDIIFVQAVDEKEAD